MGYQRKIKTYKLVFEDPECEGLEVRMRGLSVGRYKEVLALRQVTEESPQTVDELLATFVGAVIEWNLEDETGRPLPVTVDGVNTLDLDFAMDLVNAWMAAVGGVDAPLPQSSPAGEPSPEASIPMAPLSPSLAS